MSQSPHIVYPALWLGFELKDVRVSVLEAVNAIAAMQSPNPERLAWSAVFLFDDLGVNERLVAWELFLTREEDEPFSDFVCALDKLWDGAEVISEYDPIPTAAFDKVQKEARTLLSVMEGRGWHEFRD